MFNDAFRASISSHKWSAFKYEKIQIMELRPADIRWRNITIIKRNRKANILPLRNNVLNKTVNLFQANVSLMEKPGEWFLLAKYV